MWYFVLLYSQLYFGVTLLGNCVCILQQNSMTL